MSRDRDARVYVGNLPPDIRQKEIETMFDKYGKIVKIDLKNGAGRGPPFAFIEYDDYRDAEDAIRSRSGSNFDGYALRVEAPHGGRGGGRGPSRGGRYDDRRGGYDDGYGGGGYRGSYGGRDRYDDRGGYDRDRGGYGRDRDRGNGYDRGYDDRDRDRRRENGSGRKKQYKVMVTGMPKSATVEDLKKHMKDAGDVVSAEIREGTGYIEFENNEDYRYALRKLDNTEMETEEGSKATISVKEDQPTSPKRSKSRSPIRRRSPSASPPPKKQRSRSKSRSRTP